MKEPLINAIVPIYMIGRYVGIGMESLLNQIYKNLDIMLVDDDSKARCPEIYDLCKGKDERIKAVHKENGCLVSARKAELQEYYVDGNDWIGPGFIEELYTAASTSVADMVCAGFTRNLFSKSSSFLNYLPSGIYEGEKLKKLWESMFPLIPTPDRELQPMCGTGS